MSCLTPFTVRDKITNQSLAVPCGKCENCLKRRVSGWSFRLMQEERRSISSMFLTLTYDTEYVPISTNRYMTLNKRDVQLFMKRLRKSHEKLYKESFLRRSKWPKLKYYLCGEYGGTTHRPHYHVLLFNAESCLIQDAWKMGHIHYGKVSAASVGYTLKYMSKLPDKRKHSRDDRAPEFSLMSKGLGANYLTSETLELHHSDIYRCYLTIEDGKKIAMPRYYKLKLYDKTQLNAIGAHYRAQSELDLAKNLEDNPSYFRERAEAAAASFRRIGHNAKQRDKL